MIASTSPFSLSELLAYHKESPLYHSPGRPSSATFGNVQKARKAMRQHQGG